MTAAVPLPASLQHDLQTLSSVATSAEIHSKLEQEIEAKKKARVLNCAHGYSPSWTESESQIRARLSDSECFSKVDAEMARWAAWRHVGLLLEMPPLRPKPKTLPAAIDAPFRIEEVHVAANAGVLLLTDHRSVQLIDLNSGQPLLSLENVTSGPGDDLSANGRVFVVINPRRTSLIDSESGREIASLPDVPARDFFFLNSRTVLFNRFTNGMAVKTLDLVTSEERTEAGIQSAVKVTPITGRPGEFIAFATSSVLRLGLTNAQYGDPISVLDEKKIDARVFGGLTGGMTADGLYYTSAPDVLHLTSTTTLATTEIALNPFYVTQVVPLPDPQLLLIRGRVDGAVSNGRHEYVYSLSHDTFAPVDPDKLVLSRIEPLPHLQKIGIVSGQHLRLVDQVPVLSPLSRDEFLTGINMELAQFQARVAAQRPRTLQQRALPPLQDFPQHMRHVPVVPSIPAVTDAEVREKLAVTKAVGCISMDSVRSTYTAADLYFASRDCVQHARYDMSVPLFILAGAYARYDAARIVDKKAAQSAAEMVMYFSAGFTPIQREGFADAHKRFAEAAAHAGVCAAIRQVGPPNYFPSYLVMHSLAPFARTPVSTSPLDPNFNSQASWEPLLRDSLLCNP